jgi:hypothetical protein
MTIAERLLRGKRVDTGQNDEAGKGAAEPPQQGRKLPRDAVLVIILVLASTCSFGLGVVAGREGGGGAGDGKVSIKGAGEAGSAAVASLGVAGQPEATQATSSAQKSDGADSSAKEPGPGAQSSGGQYVASKTGTKYYLPWCGTAKRIKDDNKVWFATKAEAEAAGYTPAKNCKGI